MTEQLRFKLWNSDDCDGGHVAVDPFAVASVVESYRRRAYASNNAVAVICMASGKEYVVEDDGRLVAAKIWMAKSGKA